ncbi:NAD-glutamate dehydrogenase [Candidatus Tokpelaia sp.]|uniref:NAD-glutamate dehydrogenase n=1 Tax=Candidatus Tokpelaia sp. TaxID=2233777 RepID=UPI0012391A30|nr:NAD-glutamate dehydrogenase [Candidatus Tokpelaia sp.]KAA6406150.1 NAD-glutamate dehydrogenase [Candidatus Tokpelaia sp.]
MARQAAEQGVFAPAFILKTEAGKAAVEAVAAGQTGANGAAAFGSRIFAHAGAEDLAAYSAREQEKAALAAAQALVAWQPGAAIIRLDKDYLTRKGEKVSVLTLVNSNKPFLFDSVIGEIYGRNQQEAGFAAGDERRAALPPAVFLVAHPVFAAFRQSDNSLAIAQPGLPAAAGAVRISLIQIHLQFADDSQAEELLAALRIVTEQVRLVFHDRASIEQALAGVQDKYRQAMPAAYQSQRARVLEFLSWLVSGNFVFLGLREYAFSQKGGKAELRPQGAELGILTDADIRILRDPEKMETSEEILSFMKSGDLMLVTKARTRSLVHRNAFLDYIGLKLFDNKGRLSGELRLVGLFTANAYHASVLHIPYLRPKAEAIMTGLGYDRADHSGRSLLHILETYPRDDMFRLPVAALAPNADIIRELGERPRICVLSNADRFGHFVSLLVFVPRDRYNTAVHQAVGAALLRAYDGDFYESQPRFFDESLTRIHYIVHRKGGAVPAVAITGLEAEIGGIIGTWEDKVQALAKAMPAPARIAALAARLPQSYRDVFAPQQALFDAAFIAALSATEPLYVEFYCPVAGGGRLSLRLFHRGRALHLSQRVPILENMGFRVISEQTVEIPVEELPAENRAGIEAAAAVYIHAMELENLYADPEKASAAAAAKPAANLAALFRLVWAGQAADDSFNALLQSAGLSLEAVFILRAYGRYLQQAGVPYSQDRLAAALNHYPAIARALYQLFCLKFDPELQTDGIEKQYSALEAALERDLQNVPALDDDRIIRAFRNLIAASLRSNAFAAAGTGTDKIDKAAIPAVKTLAFKFDPHKIDNLPQPRPYREIFVYGPLVEGVHLRFGPVARGGIRWSDRGQDYRTEILGLGKAQQVKNAVIVPVGAKGGFYPHYLPAAADRAAVSEAARQAYMAYIAAMLSITDNISNGEVVPAREALVRHDGDDPYFVVAADKGTAAFSDTANALSREAGFWLDDAFASGGSEGYDHKAMGITAKGAWEAVKRHFREMNHNIQSEPFTAVGVGDMSGDVFGNGMLLSEKTRLLAAFDHRDIFIDPEPDCAAAYNERQRLFALPRSSWQDYDKSKISAGGGVFSRLEKNIKLSPQAAKAIGFDKTNGTPFEIMAAILRAPVDLLWFGGIGTYIRGTNETNAQVSDRANDALRITGQEVRAKVIGEGANLGVTQNGRVEYAFAGGRINTDAIDNSAGVNCSDIEVNIKIALAAAQADGRLTRKQRNSLLKAMTAEVSTLILRNNYVQSLALSLGQQRAAGLLPYQIRFMNELEARGLLDRIVEVLPDNRILAERQEKGLGLTRPELAVLMAYAKNTLAAELTKSDLVLEPYFEETLLEYFPQAMRADFAEYIRRHPLRRDIIATILANDSVNRGGVTFVSRLHDKSGRSTAEIVRSFIVVRDGFGLKALFDEIDALDNKIAGLVQNRFYEVLSRMIFATTDWILRNVRPTDSLHNHVAMMKNVYQMIAGKLTALIPDYLKEKQQKAAKAYEKQGAPEALAEQLALLELAAVIPDIILVAQQTKADIAQVAQTWFACVELLGLPQLEEAAARIIVRDYYDGLALEQAQNSMAESLRAISLAVLKNFAGAAQPVEAWQSRQRETIADNIARLQALQGADMNVSRLTIAAGILADLAADSA